MARNGVETSDDLHTLLLRVNTALERRGEDAWAEMSKGYKGMSQEVSVKTVFTCHAL